MLAGIGKLGSIVAFCILSVTAMTAHYLEGKLERASKQDILIESLPLELGEWRGENLPGLGVRPREILRLDRALRRIYRNSKGDEVFIYIGYWSQQSGEHQAAKHSPAVCLPANGWRVSHRERRILRDTSDHQANESATLKVNSLLGELNHERSLFYYWFFSGEARYAEEWQALIYIVLETFLHKRSDGGIIELSARVPKAKEVDQAIAKPKRILEEFSEVFLPAFASLPEK